MGGIMATQVLEQAAAAHVSGNAKVLLIELARRADKTGVTDLVSYLTLSEAVGIAASTVCHGVTRLLDLRLVARVERVAGVGSKYRVLSQSQGSTGGKGNS
jgi:hypothetical protein